nr:peptidoglycan-binding protein [uncultured Albidiferax sp.]
MSTLTDIQKATALAIVNIFETGLVRGDYGAVTVAAKDTGHLTFGRTQTTLAVQGGAGLLAKLLTDYCNTPGARFARGIQPYLQRLGRPDLGLDTNTRLHNLLRASSDDLVMRQVQDAFFDKHYWQPALTRAQAHGLELPLSVAVVYDSTVHGSWDAMRQRTDALVGGTPTKIGEKVWIQAYITARHDWLATHANSGLHATVYRMESLQSLLDYDLWDLQLPMLVRGQEINLRTLAADPVNFYTGPAPGSRPLQIEPSMQRGLDVRLFQLGLSEAGCEVRADGLFGAGSRTALNAYQQRMGLPTGDTADAALVKSLADSVV